QVTDLASKIAIFGALVASYDVVIGYTGIVSFGHAMFFGFGAYSVALAVGRFGAPTPGHLLLGFRLGVPLSALGLRHRRPPLGAGRHADRRVLPPRQVDLLRHDHAGLRRVRRHPGRAV